MKKRPYLEKNGPQLQQLFEAGTNDLQLLGELQAELRHRSTPTARRLLSRVEAALASTAAPAPGGRGRGAKPSAPPSPADEPSPPSRRTIACRYCSQEIRVNGVEARTRYACSQCNAVFEASFKKDVIQVEWAAASPEQELSDSLARKILSVEPSADFAAIKTAWRVACQQYHPDKHVGLPERLRQAADLEMKRINAAFEYLQRATAEDF